MNHSCCCCNSHCSRFHHVSIAQQHHNDNDSNSRQRQCRRSIDINNNEGAKLAQQIKIKGNAERATQLASEPLEEYRTNPRRTLTHNSSATKVRSANARESDSHLVIFIVVIVKLCCQFQVCGANVAPSIQQLAIVEAAQCPWWHAPSSIHSSNIESGAATRRDSTASLIWAAEPYRRVAATPNSVLINKITASSSSSSNSSNSYNNNNSQSASATSFSHVFESVCGWQNSIPDYMTMSKANVSTVNANQQRPIAVADKTAYWMLDNTILPPTFTPHHINGSSNNNTWPYHLVARFHFTPPLSDRFPLKVAARLTSPVFPPVPYYHSLPSSSYYETCQFKFFFYATLPKSALEVNLIELAPSQQSQQLEQTNRWLRPFTNSNNNINKRTEIFRHFRDSSIPIVSSTLSQQQQLLQQKQAQMANNDTTSITVTRRTTRWQPVSVKLPFNIRQPYQLEILATPGVLSGAKQGQASKQPFIGTAVTNMSLSLECFGIGVPANEPRRDPGLQMAAQARQMRHHVTMDNALRHPIPAQQAQQQQQDLRDNSHLNSHLSSDSVEPVDHHLSSSDDQRLIDRSDALPYYTTNIIRVPQVRRTIRLSTQIQLSKQNVNASSAQLSSSNSNNNNNNDKNSNSNSNNVHRLQAITLGTCHSSGPLAPLKCSGNDNGADVTPDDLMGPTQLLDASSQWPGIRRWIVPATGLYTVFARGARGGHGLNGYGGTGALMSAIFYWTKGQSIYMSVGQRGRDACELPSTSPDHSNNSNTYDMAQRLTKRIPDWCRSAAGFIDEATRAKLYEMQTGGGGGGGATMLFLHPLLDRALGAGVTANIGDNNSNSRGYNTNYSSAGTNERKSYTKASPLQDLRSENLSDAARLAEAASTDTAQSVSSSPSSSSSSSIVVSPTRRRPVRATTTQSVASNLHQAQQSPWPIYDQVSMHMSIPTRVTQTASWGSTTQAMGETELHKSASNLRRAQVEQQKSDVVRTTRATSAQSTAQQIDDDWHRSLHTKLNWSKQQLSPSATMSLAGSNLASAVSLASSDGLLEQRELPQRTDSEDKGQRRTTQPTTGREERLGRAIPIDEIGSGYNEQQLQAVPLLVASGGGGGTFSTNADNFATSNGQHGRGIPLTIADQELMAHKQREQQRQGASWGRGADWASAVVNDAQWVPLLIKPAVLGAPVPSVHSAQTMTNYNAKFRRPELSLGALGQVQCGGGDGAKNVPIFNPNSSGDKQEPVDDYLQLLERHLTARPLSAAGGYGGGGAGCVWGGGGAGYYGGQAGGEGHGAQGGTSFVNGEHVISFALDVDTVQVSLMDTVQESTITINNSTFNPADTQHQQQQQRYDLIQSMSAIVNELQQQQSQNSEQRNQMNGDGEIVIVFQIHHCCDEGQYGCIVVNSLRAHHDNHIVNNNNKDIDNKNGNTQSSDGAGGRLSDLSTMDTLDTVDKRCVCPHGIMKNSCKVKLDYWRLTKSYLVSTAFLVSVVAFLVLLFGAFLFLSPKCGRVRYWMWPSYYRWSRSRHHRKTRAWPQQTSIFGNGLTEANNHHHRHHQHSVFGAYSASALYGRLNARSTLHDDTSSMNLLSPMTPSELGSVSAMMTTSATGSTNGGGGGGGTVPVRSSHLQGDVETNPSYLVYGIGVGPYSQLNYIQHDRLTVTEQLGSGEFAVVYQGYLAGGYYILSRLYEEDEREASQSEMNQSQSFTQQPQHSPLRQLQCSSFIGSGAQSTSASPMSMFNTALSSFHASNSTFNDHTQLLNQQQSSAANRSMHLSTLADARQRLGASQTTLSAAGSFGAYSLAGGAGGGGGDGAINVGNYVTASSTTGSTFTTRSFRSIIPLLGASHHSSSSSSSRHQQQQQQHMSNKSRYDNNHNDSPTLEQKKSLLQLDSSNYDSLPVAVKMSKGRLSYEEFEREALIMTAFRHRNIVKLLGVCLDEGPMKIVLELLPGGNLRDFLRSNRDTNSERSQLCMGDLLVFALDISRACHYLEQRRFVHRDIAARNCLLTNRHKAQHALGSLSSSCQALTCHTMICEAPSSVNNVMVGGTGASPEPPPVGHAASAVPPSVQSPATAPALGRSPDTAHSFTHCAPSAIQTQAIHNVDVNKHFLSGYQNSQIVAKIADFGMARDVASSGYYRKTHGHLPVKWMPPECLIDGEFNSKGDVWSYGVLLWEVMSMGQLPYHHLDNERVVQMIKERYHTNSLDREPPLAMPDAHTPRAVYSIMCKCWSTDPADRPTFDEIARDLLACLFDDEALAQPLPNFAVPTSAASLQTSANQPMSPAPTSIAPGVFAAMHYADNAFAQDDMAAVARQSSSTSQSNAITIANRTINSINTNNTSNNNNNDMDNDNYLTPNTMPSARRCPSTEATPLFDTVASRNDLESKQSTDAQLRIATNAIADDNDDDDNNNHNNDCCLVFDDHDHVL